MSATVGDVTYIATAQGWMYLAVLLDLFSRRVVGWATSDTNDTTLALAALDHALQSRHPSAGLIHHTDRGSPGGFKWSSQHLGTEEWRWVQNVDVQIVRAVLRCGHRAALINVNYSCRVPTTILAGRRPVGGPPLRRR